MKKNAGLDAITDLSAEVADLADLVTDVATAIDFSPEKAELFAVMLLDAVAAPTQDAHVDMMMHPEIPMGSPASPAVPMAMETPDAGLGMPMDMPADMSMDIPEEEILEVDPAEVQF